MPPPSQRRPALPPTAGLLLVVLFWAGNFTATKVAFTEIGPLAFTAVRFALGSLIFWLVLRRVEGPGPAIPRPVMLRLIGLGVIGNTVYQLFFVEGLMLVSATKSALILAALPVAVTAGAGFFRIEEVVPRQWVAVIVAS
ncbi:MAG TPA: DMT family transporter, partial [Gemmatimonadales bacterium]|nr:DMT family transporter [Gemmatimonadales bacterium]